MGTWVIVRCLIFFLLIFLRTQCLEFCWIGEKSFIQSIPFLIDTWSPEKSFRSLTSQDLEQSWCNKLLVWMHLSFLCLIFILCFFSLHNLRNYFTHIFFPIFCQFLLQGGLHRKVLLWSLKLNLQGMVHGKSTRPLTSGILMLSSVLPLILLDNYQ